MTPQVPTSIEARVIKLLGHGYPPELVSSSLGITASRISQIVAEPAVAAAISELRYKNLAKHNERDEELDSLEDTLISRLKNQLPMVCKPSETASILAKVNGAKRRGSAAPPAEAENQVVLNIVLPAAIIPHFIRNSSGQVVESNGQSLLTIEPSQLRCLNTPEIRSTDPECTEPSTAIQSIPYSKPKSPGEPNHEQVKRTYRESALTKCTDSISND